ncbi:MAG: SAM-dependent MidA family methyltransferase [Planctomycetota bacterium]|jgi:SAM-dependent MidA family methyltransferase
MSDSFSVLDLPQPDPGAIALSSRLVQKIIYRIAANGGPISFREYMQMALYEPGLGYYSAGSVKLGARGDFVTSPEISSLFGHCIGEQANQLFLQGCSRRILEFGAGSGKLCAQLLLSEARIDKYYILDLSADLIERQQLSLKQLLPAEQFDRIQWLDRLPQAFDGIVIANEVLDAMPVNIVQKAGDGPGNWSGDWPGKWIEMGVDIVENRLAWVDYATNSPAIEAIRAIEAQGDPLPQPYRSEINLNYHPWAKALAECCTEAVVILIDYGYEQTQYYHPERADGTLICHYQHHLHSDPFVYPGLQDITAFVDFDAFADAAELCEFKLTGLVSQAQFLLANGLLGEAEQRMGKADARAQIDIAQQVKTLSLPAEMGEKFKVMVMQKNMNLVMPAMQRGMGLG